ncbi:MAG TPA: ATP-binding protein, partial [Aggregatilineales bacterium]|nr:ATP-binding protein [Aggregatilineales bacterium]
MDDDTLSPIERSYMEENDCKSILRVSLSADHRNHGFLEIRDTQRQHEFTDAEIKMTLAIARQTAIAMNRAQLYRALEQSEARNTIILDSQPDMVFQHASDGTFVDFRAGNEARLYTMPENFLGKKPEDVMPPEVSLLARQAIERVQESGEPQVFEYDLIMNGQVRQYECRMVTAGPGIIFSFARDITVRKQAQQHELDLSLERERVKILEEFVSDASHDLRTPISNLKSRIYLLRRAQSEEAQERQVEVMETEIMRLENLIEDLLTMTQLDADSSTDSYSQIDINYLLQELVDASQFAARQKNIDLSFHPQNIPRIPGNMGQINRIFANLLNNAINYTPEGCISIYTRLKDNGVCVEFSDTGIGIAPEDLPYIFDRFFRADK